MSVTHNHINWIVKETILLERNSYFMKTIFNYTSFLISKNTWKAIQLFYLEISNKTMQMLMQYGLYMLFT